MMSSLPRFARLASASLFACAGLAIAISAGRPAGPERSPVNGSTNTRTAATRLDANASREAFLQVYKVLTSPRCQNCHPAGDAPLQGDDSHVHIQDVKRGKDGHGVYGMRCDTCHQTENLPGEHMPPGNPKWALPPPEHKMVFVGRTAAELCRQLKDPKQNGGRSLEQIFEHISQDDLVGWGWSPGDGRSLPPLTRTATSAQLRTWIDGGAACTQ